MVPFERDYTMAFDRRMAETMVYNLLSNAIKYVPRRGSVTLRLQLDGRKVLISVEDSGPGLSEEQQKSLFSPFMHGYVGSGGMGIGLYTARQMALLHKGDLTYGRAAGLTVFTVELPADESVYAAGDYGAEPPADETGTPGAGGDVRELLPEPLNDVTVAIVEDDPDMMEQLRTEIGAYFRTECYPDGESAADGLPASGVALVVCDVMLPGIDGYELVRRLRHNAATASVPVIMLTALDDDEHALRGYKAGADDYMGKPCNFVLLAAKAARLIAWRSHGRAEAAGGAARGAGRRGDGTGRQGVHGQRAACGRGPPGRAGLRRRPAGRCHVHGPDKALRQDERAVWHHAKPLHTRREARGGGAAAVGGQAHRERGRL